MPLLGRVSMVGRAALAALLALAALPIVLAFPSGVALAGPPPVFTMFVPFNEQHISDALFSIYGPGAPARQPVVTTIDITSAADGSIMYWDHWEDGYEADIANPVQPTTRIWGDGNPANGAPPGVPGDLLNAGTVVFIQNNVALPRNPATILFDGRDKVASTRGFALSRAGWDAGLGTLHAGAVAATDLSKYGTQFTIPVGENTGFGAFNYSGVSVMASDDNTIVEFDLNGDGTVDQVTPLAQGATVFVDGGVNAGATISATKPVQTHLITGRRNSRYEGRWFEIFPAEIRGDEYVAAAGSTSDAERVTIFLQNPGASTITVAVDAEFTANDTNIDIAPGAVAAYDLPNGSGARFSSPGNPFIAVSGTVAVTGRTTWFDWGYSLVPTSSLTPGVVVGWGAGNPDGTQNYSPVWVAPLADTTLYVDIDGDQVVDQTIPNVQAYESVRIIDTTDNDMTGARIYTTDGTLISSAWGQDPAGNECCNAYDLGTAVLPSTALVTTKSARIVVDVNGDGNLNPGDTLEYTIRSVDAGALSLTNIVVQDQLPATLTYVPNSTIVDGSPVADDTVGTPFPVDGAGVLIPVLAPGASADVVFRAQLVDPFPLFTETVRNTVLATADQGSATATSILPVVIPDLYIAKSSAAPGPLLPGQVFDYVIDVSNVDQSPQTGIDVTDALPPELTWLSTTVTRPIDDPAPGGSNVLDDTFSPAQYNNNPTEWVTDWIETDSGGGGATGGNVRIVSELGSNRVRLRGGNSAITRTFDGAAWDEARLTYAYRPDSLDGASDWVSFQISTTGGTSWIELDRVVGPLTNAAYSTLSYDLTRYLGQNIALRWVTSPGFSSSADSFYIDDVAVAVNRRVIEVVPGGPPPALYSGGELLTGENLTITVSVQLDAAVDPATDSITNVATAVSAENASPVMSSATDQIARATIGDTVWHDEDGDGVVDTGEPRLSGVTVTLYDGGGTAIATDVTDATGSYAFDDLDPGDYTVAVTAGVPAGMATTFDPDGGYDESTAVTVGFGEVNATTDFGYAFPVALGDRIFGDIGGDGVENGNDFGIDALTVTITGPSHPSGTTTTTSAGTYGFANLLPGTYTVDVDTSPLSPAAYSTTGGNSQVVVLTSGTDDLTVDFGFVLPAAIGDRVFHDLDADGVQDAGEPPFVGVEVTITGAGLPVGGVTTTTDAAGYYLFSNLDAGDFTVTVSEGTGDLPVGYDASTPGGLVQTRSLLADDIVTDVDFGFFTQATIGDFVFDDVNGNGAWDAGEPGVDGVPITITGPSFPGGTTVVTAGGGLYDVTVDPGTYAVVPDTSAFPLGTVNSFDGASPSVTVASADDLDTADFGYVFPATIGDLVFHDLNDDGLRQPGEPGLDGVELTITGGTLPPGTTTTTSGGGAYLFSGLGPGVYTVTVNTATVPGGYVSSTGGDSVGGIAVVSGNNRLDVDFGYRGTADIGDLVYHDLDADGVWDAGEPGLPGVVVTLAGPGIPPGTTDTTDAGGNYLFTDLVPGAYAVTVDTATVPAGYTVTAGTDSRSVTLESDTDDLTADLGYATTASIGDFVWEDLDGDGLFDAGEPGFDGVTVTLDDGVTPITQDTVNGAYDFTGVAPGTYTVTVDAADLPAGVVNTLGGVSRVVTVVSAQDENDADFGYYVPASIGDIVWDDLDGDGAFDAGEPGFAGVTITLTGGALPPGGITDVTDGAGGYGFTGLAPGTYTATLTSTDLPAGAVNTFGGTSQVVTVVSGAAEGGVDFGFYVPGSIGDFVWDDLDGDGVQDDGPASVVGIGGVDVTITGPSHPGGLTVTTDADGGYSFAGLAPGAYDVVVDTGGLPAGAVSSTGGFSVVGVPVVSGAVVESVDFGVVAPISVGDAVFDDLDGDGLQGAGEPGLAGVDVTITGPSHPGGSTVSTDAFGVYRFSGLLPGTYTLDVDAGGVPAGYGPSSPVSVTASYVSGDAVDTVDFGFVSPADVGDLVFEDVDGDGVFDPGEPGLALVTLELSGPGVAPGTSVTTGPSGAYGFGGLDPGTYTVSVTGVPAGYTNTVGGAAQVATLSSGESDGSLDFGFYLGASIGDLVFDDLDGDGVLDPGEPGFDAVTVTLDDGTTTITRDTVNGAYDFVGLTPGTYTVTVDIADLPAGAVNTVGGPSQTFTVVSGDDVDTADFGYYRPGSIGDYVWNDVDGDGVQDDGPPPSVGFGGVDVTITGPSHPGGTTVTTDANGAYVLGGLAPGSYDVVVDTADLPPGSTSTTGGFSVTGVSVVSGAAVSTIDFGVAIPASVGDLVFADDNGNAVFDAGDTPLAGVGVTITGPGLPVGGLSDVTDAAGVYGFGGLAPGTFTVTVDGPLPPGAFSTTGGGTRSVTLSSAESDLTVDFGFAEPAAIGDLLFHDLDNDGVRDPGEPGIADVDVVLTGPGQPPGGTVISTGPAGGYAFTGLAPGTYTVTVDTADADMNPAFVSSTGGDAQTRTLASADVITDVDFGYTAPGVIGDLVFVDDNADGDQSGDSGLAGVTLTLTGGALPPSGVTTITDAAGGYSFGGVLPGAYTVTVTGGLPAGAFTTTGGDSQPVTISSGQIADTIDFGYAQPALIGDFVFDDLDGDGAVDAGEPGYGAVDVTIVGPTHPGGFTTTTDAAGAYTFGGLTPGAYTITVDTADLPAGAVNTLGGPSRTVTVTSGENHDTADFGYYQPAAIGDLVFDDLDGDGTHDPGEPGYSAITVTLDDGTTTTTQDTDAAGAYTFTGLAPGAYTITVDTADLPPGATNTLGGPSRTITVISGENHDTADFGYYQPATIGDYVWDDLDGDGVQDDGPASTVGIGGVDVTITGPSHPGGSTVTTDPAGGYSFGGLAPGTYTVSAPLAGPLAGGVATTGATTRVLTVTSGGVESDVDFGIAFPATIGDTVFDDVNGDGIEDPGDAGFPAVDLTIVGPSHPGGTTVTTDGSGNYGFGGLLPGSYTVTVDTSGLPAGAASTTGGDAQTIVVESGETNDAVDFGYALPASIGDQLFVDDNGNGAFDAGDTGIADVDLTITGPGLPVGGVTVTTGPTGAYGITSLEPGTFTVTVDTGDADFDPAWVSTTGGDAQLVPISSGDVIDTVDFGYAAPATVGDTVFDDLDGDGIQQPGEPGIAGVTVTLTGGDLGGPITTSTSATGGYTFGGLTPGDYVVSTAVPGFGSTTGGDNQNVSLSSGEIDDTIDFGYAAVAALGDTVYHDLDGDGVQDTGEPGLPGIVVTLVGPGVPPGTTDTTDGAGRYGFGGLAPGSYTVTVDTAGLPTPAHASTTGGDSVTVVLVSGETDGAVDFGYAAPAEIGDLVWDDLDGDGLLDAGEPGFDGVTVTLDDGVSPITQDTVGGAYNFTGLAPGAYTITVDAADLPAGAVNTFGGAAQTLTVQSTDVVTTVDFGYYRPGSIGDLVFEDGNGNGTFNLGESGLDGVEVTLTGGGLGAPLVTTTALGGYSFTGLAPGDYTVTLTGGIPAGATSTTGGNAQSVTIVSGADLQNVDFGLAENVTVGDRVWHDLDGDGVQDAGEPGLPGVDVQLRDDSNVTIATATSDGAGGYLFTGVAPGTYTVVVDTATVPPSYAASTAESFPITVTSGNDIVNVDIGYHTTGSIGDLVWEDLDGDGTFDAGEPGLDGLTVTLTGGGLGGPLTTITGGGGAYAFTGLDPGAYTVTVSPPGSGASTTGGDTRTVTIASAEDRLDVDFGYALAATIGDRVWHDLDGDGAQDAGEPGLGGVAVTLAGPSGPATTTTDGLGNYVFAGLVPGAHTVSYDPGTAPIGAVSGAQFAPTTPASVVVPLQSGDDVVTADIGLATTGTISGTIYEDDDADGVEAPGESGLVSVTMELVDGAGVVVATATTDGNGDYTFAGVPPGDYTVRVDESTVPAGFARTSPASVAVTVVSDQAVSDIDVGYARPASIGDLVWHDLDADGAHDPGEPGLAGVVVELVDGAGVVVATMATDGGGAYAFGGVAPGAYTVRVDLASLPAGVNTGAAFVATSGVPSAVPLTVGSSDVVDTVDFAFHTTAVIGDLVWHDLDADSIHDPGEPGLAVTVELVEGGVVIATAPTAADGAYSFPGVAPGTYDIRVTGEPALYSSTTGNDPSTVVVVSDQVDDTVDFGFAQLTGGSIGNEVWDDLDGDGIRDPGEPGIGGVTVDLVLGGVTVGTRVTPATGAYLFANLAPGSYEVRVDPTTLPVGYVATTPGADSGNTQGSTLLSGQADLDVDFGYAAPATVGDLVWHDLDGDGVRDAGEPGLPGVVLELIDGGGVVVDTATTDASGAYTLSTALAGDYTVVVDPASTPTGAGSGDPMVTTTATAFPVTLTSNEVRTDLDVGYVTTAAIGDTIFDDLDGDGVQDPGEPGLAGVTVVLTDGGGGTATQVTGPGGLYDFVGLAPGSYSVGVDGVTLPAGAVPTTTTGTVSVSVVSDEVVDDVDLGFALPASLAGMVFLDAAGDGSHAGDSGVAGVVVELLDAGGVVLATTTTFADGSYVFTGLLPGGWIVRPVLPNGHGFTIPDAGDDALDSDVLPSGQTATISLVSGQNVVDVDAGIFEPATIGDTVWVDLDGDGVQDPGEPGLPGVVVELRNAGGALVATTTTGVDGSYAFSVDPGLYTVSIATPSGYRIDAAAGTLTVGVLSGETDPDVDFGVVGVGVITGDVVYDVAADGAIDPSDPGHHGVTVTATWDGPDGLPGTADDVTFTAATNDGAYSFESLPPGDYVVAVDPTTLPDGLIDPTVDPDGVVDLVTAVTVGGTAVGGLDFATTGTAMLGDNVFRDDNENGVLDPGEPGVGGVTVIATVVTTSGVSTYTTVTDASGFYQFTDLPAGDYVVTLDLTTIPVGLVPSIISRSTTLVINGVDDTLDLALVLRPGPVAVDDEGETPANTPVVIPVLDNDTVPAGMSVTVTAVTQPANGVVSINPDGTVTYTPNLGFAGADVFTYTICDLASLAAFGDTPATRLVFCSTATVSVVTPPPDPASPGNQTTTPTPGATPTPVATPTPAATPTPSTPPPATPPPASSTPLPKSGSESGPIQALALAFLAAGLAMVLASRRREESADAPTAG